MRKRCLLLLLCLVLSVSHVSYAHGADFTPSQVEASLKDAGGQATLEKFFSCEHDEGTAYPKIATGNTTWVALGVKILGYSDACYAEGIVAALGQAMQNRPHVVLPYVNSSLRLTADRICLPFISDELPVKDQLSKVRVVKKSILRVSTPRLAAQKKACLDLINGFELRLQEKKP